MQAGISARYVIALLKSSGKVEWRAEADQRMLQRSQTH